MTLTMSLAQITSTEDPDENLALIDTYTAQAAAAGARLVIFPEAMMRCFGAGSLAAVAQELGGPWPSAVRRIAEREGVTVVVGMFTPAGDGRVRNTLLVTGAGVDADYHKIHLYDAFGFAESETVAAGADPLLVDIDGTLVGFATCYDIRFPGLFQELADRGAALTVVCASWGSGPGKVDQWQILARARALDSTTFVAACDQAEPRDAGTDASPRGVGHSLVVSPVGEILGSLGADPGLLTVEIDPAAVPRVRQGLPVLANRRY